MQYFQRDTLDGYISLKGDEDGFTALPDDFSWSTKTAPATRPDALLV